MSYDSQIRKLEVGVKPYVEDGIKAIVHELQTYFDRFESKILAKVYFL